MKPWKLPEHYWKLAENVTPLVMMTAAIVLALYFEVAGSPNDIPRVTLWLLTLFLTSEVGVRLSAILRIESKIDELRTPHLRAEVVLSPQDVWRRATSLLQSQPLQMIDTTSLKNSPEYESSVAAAAATGAEITRIICSTQQRPLSDFIDPPPLGARVRLLHAPIRAPFDYLIAEPDGRPTVIIGIPPRAPGHAYDAGLQINDLRTALLIKHAIISEYESLAQRHMRTHGGECPLCKEIAALQSNPLGGPELPPHVLAPEYP